MNATYSISAVGDYYNLIDVAFDMFVFVSLCECVCTYVFEPSLCTAQCLLNGQWTPSQMGSSWYHWTVHWQSKLTKIPCGNYIPTL